MIKIAIDAMGGDFAPKEQVKGTVEALKNDKELFAVLCGDEEILKKELSAYTYDSSRVEIVHAPEVITNDEIPTKAVRTKKDSSTVTAFRPPRSAPEFPIFRGAARCFATAERTSNAKA